MEGRREPIRPLFAIQALSLLHRRWLAFLFPNSTSRLCPPKFNFPFSPPLSPFFLMTKAPALHSEGLNLISTHHSSRAQLNVAFPSSAFNKDPVSLRMQVGGGDLIKKSPHLLLPEILGSPSPLLSLSLPSPPPFCPRAFDFLSRLHFFH